MIAGGGDGFRLLDPAGFDWSPPPAGSRRDWTLAEGERWADGLRLAAEVAEAYADRHPGQAAAFRAFAVTLRTRADIGPGGALHPESRPFFAAASSVPAPPEEGC